MCTRPEVKLLGDLRTEDFSDRCLIRERHVVLDADYAIELARCDSPEKILGWAHHLSGKRWMDRKLLRHFIRTVAGHHGIALRCG